MGIEQLVDMYKGNPGPLDEKVKKAQQGKAPGEIPEDLEEAIALQKIANLQTGAKNQQAIQAGGAQPSIVEKLRQMLAANQRQQAQPPQMPQGAPQGMPQGQPQMAQGQPPQGQPPMQGQPVMAASGGSIAQLMSNLGRHYAGGGIIAFNGEDESKVEDEEIKKKLEQYTLQQQGADWVARKQAARLAEAENEARRQAMASQIPKEGRAAPASTGRMPGEFERNISNTLASMPGASVVKPFSGSGIRALMGLLGISGDREDTAASAATERKPHGGRTDMVNDPRLARDFNPTPTGPGAGKAPGEAIKNQITGTSPDDIRPSAPRPTVSRVDNAPMPAGLGLPSIGVGRDYERRMLAENEKFDPEAYKAKFLKEVGSKDVSIYDEMAAELKARKERLKNPEPGFDSLMEYLGQIAQGGGRNWMESGARGAAGVKALQKSRQDQQDILVDKILELGSKKKEAEYNERLGLFNLTKTEKDRVKSESKDIAKSLGLAEDKAIELQQQMTIEMMRDKTSRQLAGMPGAEQKFFNQMANDWLSKPENKGKTVFDAYAAFRLAGAPSAAGKGMMTRNEASDNVMKKIAYDSPIRNQLMTEAAEALKKSGISAPSATQITDYLIDKELGKANAATTASSGRVVDFNALPK